MLSTNFYAAGALLLAFLGTTWADACYNSGYKFSDLLGDDDLNSTFTGFCQDYDGKQFRNGDTIPNSCVNTRQNNKIHAHIDIHIEFSITDTSGSAKLTVEACKDVLFQATKKCQQGSPGVLITYGEPQAPSRRLRNARDQSGVGNDERNPDGVDDSQSTLTVPDYTTVVSTTFVPPAPVTQTVFDTITATESETAWITVTAQPSSSAVSKSSISSASNPSSSMASATTTATTASKVFNPLDCLLMKEDANARSCMKLFQSIEDSIQATSSSSSNSMNTAFAALIKLDPNECACSGCVANPDFHHPGG